MRLLKQSWSKYVSLQRAFNPIPNHPTPPPHPEPHTPPPTPNPKTQDRRHRGARKCLFDLSVPRLPPVQAQLYQASGWVGAGAGGLGGAGEGGVGGGGKGPFAEVVRRGFTYPPQSKVADIPTAGFEVKTGEVAIESSKSHRSVLWATSGVVPDLTCWAFRGKPRGKQLGASKYVCQGDSFEEPVCLSPKMDPIPEKCRST